MDEWRSPIPRTIHLIWIGHQPLPDYFTKYFHKSFLENMPEFKIHLWRNKDITKKNFPKTYSYIQEAKKWQGKEIIEYDEDDDEQIWNIVDSSGNNAYHNKWAQITDLMRLEIIYNQGGYYFDINFEILPSRRKHTMYNLLNSTKKKFVGCNEISKFENWEFLSNSFFGATKKNKILSKLLSRKYLDDIDFESSEVSLESGPGYLRQGITSRDNYHLFPTLYFYPFIEDPGFVGFGPGRPVKPNKCHSRKKKKKTTKKLHNKGYIQYPCTLYPKSYALKHWQLGKSWLPS